MISRPQKIFLIFSAILSLSVVVLDIVFYPTYYQLTVEQIFLPQLVVQSIPLLPILAVNYYLLRLLRHYIVRMRSERWFLGLGLLLNVFGLVALVLRILLLGVEHGSLLPLVAIFTGSLLYMGFRFFQADLLFLPYVQRQQAFGIIGLSDAEWRQKICGYSIRILAVFLWGCIPLYIRYTPVSTLSPLLRLLLIGTGIALPLVPIYFLRGLIRERSIPSISLPYSYAFFLIVFGQIIYFYLENLALLYTSGTNLLLFNNFAPVIGLFVAALLWRRRIPYLGHPKTMLWIFLLMVLSSMGTFLLIFNHAASQDTVHKISGDFLSLLSTVFDVLLTIGQIEYLRQFPKTNGMLLNLHLAFYLIVSSSLILMTGVFLGWIILPTFSQGLMIFGIGLGVIMGIGLLFNYEAFKRIDGYIAYMLFNLSVVVSFAFEALIVGSVSLSLQLLASATLIIVASIIAEYINCRAKLTN